MFALQRSVYLPWNRGILSCAFAFWLGTAALWAQILPKPIAITTENGLGFRHVNYITQDNSGLIWLATQKGIERYDGYEFKTYNNSKYAHFKVPIDKVLKIQQALQDKDVLLVHADDKLFTLNVCNHDFREIILPKPFDGLVKGFYQSGNQKLYLSVIKGQKLLFGEYAQNKFVPWAESPLEKYYGNTIKEDGEGNIWWSNVHDGLIKFSPGGQKIKSILLDSFMWYGHKFYYSEYHHDTVNKQMLIFPKSKNEVWLYDEKTKTKTIIAKDLTTPVYHAVTDEQKNLWFATKTQLFMYNKNDKVSPLLDFSQQVQNQLQFTGIQHLFVDKLNVLWIATNNGLIKLPLSKQLFGNLLYNRTSDWSNEMRGIVQTKDKTIYAYCENGNPGLYKTNGLEKKSQLIYPFPNDIRGLDGINYLCYDDQKNVIWALSEKLICIDMATEKARYIPFDLSAVTSKIHHNPLARLKDGRLLMGFNLSKLTLYDPKTNLFRKILIPNKQAENIITEVFVEDQRGDIWVGTNSGIFILNNEGKLKTVLDEHSSPALSKNHVLCIYVSPENRIWVGTFGGGLNVLQYGPDDKLVIQVFDTKKGLCDDNITAIADDKKKNIWVSSYNGISRYDAKANIFQNFYLEDGLTHNEFNYTSSMVDDRGLIWFGGLNGINIIDPEKTLNQKSNPGLVLTSFTKYNPNTHFTHHEILNCGQLPSYKISPSESWFQFNWSLPNYFKNDKSQYYVWLDGLEPSWSYHGNTPFIRYYNLKYGSYTLRVKAYDSKGNPSSGELAIPFTVLPFFYQTWWFTLFWIGGLAGLFYLLYRYNLNKKLAMERMRTQIASDLHDEIGSMLSGLAMQSELLQAGAQPVERKRFQVISDLSRTVVSKMRDLVWSIDSRSDTVQDLLDKMHEKLATLLGSGDISYRLNVGDLPRDKTLSINVRQQLFLIFNESIVNVLRHSHATNVLVEIGNQGPNFIMRIQDNGFPGATTIPSTGMGLKNIYMRAEKIQATVEITQKDGFEVKLTMHKW
ncbi:MAG: hypothetical protein IPN29_05620 [Saprospiraceae bacterium]|nr:hypothetical protein [Saprospiraceae bacterium]